MAGDWIKVEKATPRKREVLIIAGKLKIHPDHAFGLCFRFWSWCDDNLSDRYASGVTEALLDQLLGYDGFATAAVDVGWLLSRNGSIEVPNFDRHLSQSAKKRALSKDRNKSKRKRDASSVTKASPEKRREEKSIKKEREAIPDPVAVPEFAAPTADQVQSYIDYEHSLNPNWPRATDLTGESFVDHYNAQGWVSGNGIPIVNWRSKVKIWGNKAPKAGKGGAARKVSTNATFAQQKSNGNDEEVERFIRSKVAKAQTVDAVEAKKIEVKP